MIIGKSVLVSDWLLDGVAVSVSVREVVLNKISVEHNAQLWKGKENFL